MLTLGFWAESIEPEETSIVHIKLWKKFNPEALSNEKIYRNEVRLMICSDIRKLR